MTNENANERAINCNGAQQGVFKIKTEKSDPEIEAKLDYLRIKVERQSPENEVYSLFAKENCMIFVSIFNLLVYILGKT